VFLLLTWNVLVMDAMCAGCNSSALREGVFVTWRSLGEASIGIVVQWIKARAGYIFKGSVEIKQIWGKVQSESRG
jgi:hypothetical protein